MFTPDPAQHLIEDPSAETQVKSAARRAYEILDIRLHIIWLLARSDQARFLRVEKLGLALVARELYRTVDYNRAQALLQDDNDRQQIYIESIKVIDATRGKTTITPEQTLRFSEADPAFAKRPEYWLDEYHPEIINELVPPLREGFPSLVKIEFGRHYQIFENGNEWVVHLTPRQSETSSSQIPHSAGHIHHIDRYRYNVSDDPPSGLTPLIPPQENYTSERRFDMIITVHKSYLREPLPPISYDKWLFTLRNAEWLGDLYKTIDTGSVPVEAADVVSILQRQTARGHQKRLVAVITPYILPFDIDEFHDIARASLRNLIVLNLFDHHQDIKRDDKPKLSFKDVPKLISILRGDLPGLIRLYIGLGGVETAEADCRSLLCARGLEKRGSLRLLIVTCTEFPSFPFNFLRSVLAICVRGVEVHVGPRLEFQRKFSKQYIEYPRKQRISRRRHLDTVDFGDLDVVTLKDLLSLQYGADGRPRRIGTDKAVKWSKQAEELEGCGVNLIPRLTVGLRDITSTSTQFKADAAEATTTTADMLKGARDVLKSVRAMCKAAEQIKDVISDGRATEREIKQYIAALELIEKRGVAHNA